MSGNYWDFRMRVVMARRDGCCDHHLEQIIEAGMAGDDPEDALACLGELSEKDADLLRCMARIEDLGNAAWRVGVVRRALGSRNLDVRDAALDAAESWMDTRVGEVVAAHRSREPDEWITEQIDELLGWDSPD